MPRRLTPALLDRVAAALRLPAGFRLARGKAADLPGLLDLARQCFTYDVPDRASMRYSLLRAHAAFFVIWRGEVMAGYCFAEANLRTQDLYVNTVCLAPQWRGKGLGRAAYQALIAVRDAAQYRALTAHVEVGNKPAIRLMHGLGFRTLARIENYYYDNGEAALKMRLDAAPDHKRRGR